MRGRVEHSVNSGMSSRLTELLSPLPTIKRIAARRRIEAIADYWALYLRSKHGEEAAYRCRCHQVATTKNGAHLRNHIWCLVAHRLKEAQRLTI